MDQATNEDTGRVVKRKGEWYEKVDQLRADRKYIYPSQPGPRFGKRLVYGLHTGERTNQGSRSCKSESPIIKRNRGYATANSWNERLPEDVPNCK